MNHSKYVFSQLTSFLNRSQFNDYVRKYHGDKYVKLPKNQENIRKKREIYHFTKFNQYEFEHNGRTFVTMMAVCENEYEQFYSIIEQ